MIVSILPAPVFAWLANVKMSAVRQRAAIAQLKSQGMVHVQEKTPTPYFATNLIRTVVDQDAFNTVTRVQVDNLNKRFTRRFWRIDDFEALTHLKGLRNLSLMHRSPLGIVDHRQDRIKLPSAVLSRLSTIRSLASLSIDADLDPETQLRLAQLPEVQSLNLPGTQVTNETLRALGQSDTISSIDIDASLVAAEGLEGLAQAKLLQTLSLRHLPSDLGLLSHLGKCKALTHLQVHSTKLSPEDATVINRLPIQTLSLFYCDLDVEFLRRLKASRTLAKVSIRVHRNDGRITHFDSSLDSLDAWEDHFEIKAMPNTPTDQTSP